MIKDTKLPPVDRPLVTTKPPERCRPRCLDSQCGACSGCALIGGTITDQSSTCHNSAPLFASRVGGREKNTHKGLLTPRLIRKRDTKRLR